MNEKPTHSSGFWGGILPGIFFGLLLGLTFQFSTTWICSVLGFLTAIWFAAAYEFAPHHRVPTRSVYLGGVIAHLLTYFYMPSAMASFGSIPYASACFLLLLYSLFSALQFSILNWVQRGLQRFPLLAQYRLALPCAWLAADVLVPRLIPWTLADSQLAFVNLAQVADIFGTEAISWLIIWWGAILVFGLRQLIRKKQEREPLLRPGLAAAISCALVFAYSSTRQSQIETAMKNAESLHIGIVQANLDVFHDFTSERLAANLEKHRRVAQSIPNLKDLDLLIWPETSYGYFLGTEQTSIAKGSEFDPFPGLDAPLIFGGNIRIPTYRGTRPAFYNVAGLLENSGSLQVYRKQELLPFAEYMPLENLFSWLPEAPGKKYTYLAASDERPLLLRHDKTGREIPIATAICYEDMRSTVFLPLVRDHAGQILLTLTNDAWFGRSPASTQHHMVASWNAILFRRFFIRSTNNGITAIIDPFGRTIETITPYDEGTLTTESVKPLTITSPFTSWGHLPLNILTGVLVILALSKLKFR